MTVTPTRRLTSEEVVALNKQYTLFSWSAQNKINPIAMDHGEGIYFWDADGKRYIDFNSQLMSVNIGHGDKRVADAIAAQAHQLAFAAPQFATEVRGRLGELLATLTPGNLDTFFFTLGGAEANENALRMARITTGRQKVIAHHRSYHGATAGSISVTGDPRRWANEPGVPGVIRVLDPWRWGQTEPEPVDRQLEYLEEVIQYEGPHTIAAFILETVTGTNGILIPPDGYLQGIRAICDRHGILMICDEVMAGFGRTGRWFAVDHWDVVPDLLTMAKGLTSSYLPLGAVAMKPEIAHYFDDKVYYGGLTYSAHPVSCAAAIAAVGVLRDDDMVGNAARLGPVMHDLLAGPAGAPSERGHDPQHRSVRGHRARPQPRDDGAHGRLQRQLPGDGGPGRPAAAGRAVHHAALAPGLHQPAAVHHRGAAARGVRDRRSGSRGDRCRGRLSDR